MGNLCSALDEEATVDPSRLGGPELADRVRELDQARRRLEGIWLATLTAFHRSGEWELDGATSAGAWVAASTLLEKALDDLMRRSPDCPGEPTRTKSQRRVDALVDLCDRYLRGAMGTANRRPQISIVAGLDTLEERAGRPARMWNGEVLSGEAARRLACDASISRVVTGPRSEPLDIGRATPVVPAGMRRALEARDGGCTFPGCDRPPDWSDSHHLVHWIRGGETKIENLTLLCRRHHRLHHTRGLRIDAEREPRPRWFRPDETEIAPSARPPPSRVEA